MKKQETNLIKKTNNKQMETDEYPARLESDLNRIIGYGDFRLLALIIHLYTEYWIDKLIKVSLKKPEIILNDINLKSFSNKIKLLNANGTISNKNLIRNLEIINQIRNDFVHNLEIHKITEKAEQKINEMKIIDEEDKLSNCNAITKFQERSVLTITALIILSKKELQKQIQK